MGMTGEIIVLEAASLTLNFHGMTPHVGQDLWVLVHDKEASEDVARLLRTVEQEFTIEVTGIGGA
ncbi:MAG: hypothetical protein R2751_14630 [Bacteroidales bacterium]